MHRVVSFIDEVLVARGLLDGPSNLLSRDDHEALTLRKDSRRVKPKPFRMVESASRGVEISRDSLVINTVTTWSMKDHDDRHISLR